VGTVKDALEEENALAVFHKAFSASFRRLQESG